jgi:hypothetical protein
VSPGEVTHLRELIIRDRLAVFALARDAPAGDESRLHEVPGFAVVALDDGA